MMNKSGKTRMNEHLENRADMNTGKKWERSGELPGLIEKAAAEAVREPEDDSETQGETAT
jgi:hypothetical protein